MSPCIRCFSLSGFDIWDAITNYGASPRRELLHGIDPIALPKYQCSGPVANNFSQTWTFPPLGANEYRRAAIRVGDMKLIVGNCAEWDCSDDPGNTSAPGGVVRRRA